MLVSIGYDLQIIQFKFFPLIQLGSSKYINHIMH